MIAQELEENIQFAFNDARDRALDCLTVEHLLLVLLDTKEVSRMMRFVDSDRRQLRSLLEEFVQTRVPRRKQRPKGDPRQTPGFGRVIRKAMSHAKEGRRDTVTSVDVLIAIYSEPESFAAHYMNRCGLTKTKLNEWLRRASEQKRRSGRRGSSERLKELEHLCTDLTEAALQEKLEIPHPREDLINNTLRVLCRKYKRNPILVGEPGVGKTAIVHSIAHMTCKNEPTLPRALQNLRMFEVNVSSLVAGTKYRGDFEARLKLLVHALSEQENALLFIDEIHTIIGAGAVSGGHLDAANIFKPALADGQLKCIGATTQTEFSRIFDQDSALSRRFQKIEIPEPDQEQALEILQRFKPRLEAHHAITYADNALEEAVRLSERFLSNRSMPDKAIDLLDETAAAAAIAGTPSIITDKQLEQTVVRISGMPEVAIDRDERKSLRVLEQTLGKRVFGQDEAVKELAHAVRRARLGVRRHNKPVGSFLFAGPTGVGKTEMSKALAESLGINLIRFDMSEFMQRHTVSTLLGSPPGYIGYGDGGLLTEKINQQPHSVLLLDEIEKAHPDIFNILLQVMDHGVLTDNAGTKADFRHVVIIMTTNAGAEGWDKNPLGFEDEQPEGNEVEAVKHLFSPEFRNRLDKVIRFSPLDQKIIARVVTRELRELVDRIHAERGYLVKISARAKKWLRENGFSPNFGARPLQRLINTTIMDALVDEDATNEILAGEEIHVDCNAAGEFFVTRRQTVEPELEAEAVH